MLKSLLLYTSTIARAAFLPERKIILNDLKRFSLKHKPFHEIPHCPEECRENALHSAINWLRQANRVMHDDGFGSYHLAGTWSPTYPETTGYIITTLLNYAVIYKEEEIARMALKAAEFLCSIQKTSGGWQGGRIGEGKPEIVFNTGQIIRGLVAAWGHSGDTKFRDTFIKGCDWLCTIQHENGFWKDHALMNEARVYDTFVDAPLLDASISTGNEKYRIHALRNLEWVTGNKIRDNGWFEDCDNTVRGNDRPILHTIAYTIDGLIDCGLKLGEGKYINAARNAADTLRDKFLRHGYLNGRYESNWNGSEHMICTGAAQMAIIWMKLYKVFKEDDYLEAAERMIDLLVYIQDRKIAESPDSHGAIPGSFPVWGRYEPFAFPNWAAKFFSDALMLRKEIN
jgi:hypothetical protein